MFIGMWSRAQGCFVGTVEVVVGTNGFDGMKAMLEWKRMLWLKTLPNFQNKDDFTQIFTKEPKQNSEILKFSSNYFFCQCNAMIHYLLFIHHGVINTIIVPVPLNANSNLKNQRNRNFSENQTKKLKFYVGKSSSKKIYL